MPETAKVGFTYRFATFPHRVECRLDSTTCDCGGTLKVILEGEAWSEEGLIDAVEQHLRETGGAVATMIASHTDMPTATVFAAAWLKENWAALVEAWSLALVGAMRPEHAPMPGPRLVQ